MTESSIPGSETVSESETSTYAAASPKASLNLPFIIYGDEVDFETLQFTKTAPEMGLYPSPGPRAPLDVERWPFIAMPTSHWNRVQALIDDAGIRERWNDLQGVIQPVPKSAISTEHWELPEVRYAACRLHFLMRDLTPAQRAGALAEAVLGPEVFEAVQVRIEAAAAEASYASSLAGAQKKESTDG